MALVDRVNNETQAKRDRKTFPKQVYFTYLAPGLTYIMSAIGATDRRSRFTFKTYKNLTRILEEP
ncbi:MAG TPA: hypothetical protein DEV81_22075 [Cyanobacteria bacterium UBA11049]|nr:hypothetical protein [Cyanobacteria bacterium UBA11049]